MEYPLRVSLAASRLIGVLFSCVLLVCDPGGASNALAQSAPHAPQSNARDGTSSSARAFHKILILGNSITRHGPSQAIGWSGDWGMAASAQEKDFVHLVTGSLCAVEGAAPEVMVKNIAEFERQYAGYDVAGKLKDAIAFGADLVILAIGENVPKFESEEAKAKFREKLVALLGALRANRGTMIVVRSCFWPNAAKDQILGQACREMGGVFVDISGLGKDESNFARSERQFQHAGVAAHPGDKGMRAIADAIIHAITADRAGKR